MMVPPLALSRPPAFSPNYLRFRHRSHPHHSYCFVRFNTTCSSLRSNSSQSTVTAAGRPQDHPGIFDALLLGLFRKKMVQEVGWDSRKTGYDGLIEVVNRLMTKGKKGGSNADTIEAAVRILKSLFPPLLLTLYRILVVPIQEGKVAAVMVARVTALSCKWLMGPCVVNSVNLPDGSTCNSGVFVERCKYLEESKCVGICINTCKLPTQTFFKDYMGVPLLMEPNFQDYSCQFTFGVLPPLPDDDSTLKQPCLEICPDANRHRDTRRAVDVDDVALCPKT